MADDLGTLERFQQRFPSLIPAAFEKITKIARVVPHGQHGIAIRNLLESIAIAGVIFGGEDSEVANGR